MSVLFVTIATLGLVWPLLALSMMAGRSVLHPAKLYTLLYMMHICVPTMVVALGFAPRFVNAANQSYLVPAVFFSWLCMLAAILGGLAGTKITFARPTAGLLEEFGWRRERVYLVVGILLALGWLTKLYVIESDAYLQIQRSVQGELEGPYYAAVRMVEVFSLYGVIILVAYLSDLRRRRKFVPIGATRIAFLLMIAELMYWLPTGRKEDTILAVLLPFVTRHLLTGYVPPRKALVGFAIFIGLLFPATHYYRLAIESNITDLGSVDSASLLSLAEATATSGDDSVAPTSIVFNRVSMLEPISACIRLIDGGIWPMWLGESYAMLLISLVPRAVWPSKPPFDYGQEFGRVAGFLSVDDDATSVSVTYVGEGFLNFGWLGWVPMAAISFFFAVLFRLAMRAPDRLSWTVLYVLSLPSLLYFGGSFATYFGGLLKILPFFYLICAWMRRREVV